MNTILLLWVPCYNYAIMSYKTRLNLFMKALVLLQVCMSFISQPLKLRISPS